MGEGVTYQRVTSPKEFANGCPKFRDEKWSNNGVEEIFWRDTWSGFESRGSSWELSPHLTPLVGPIRPAPAPSRVGTPRLPFCVVLFSGGSSV
jgi:hypothetical protein